VHVIITGASGNLGTSVLAALAREPAVTRVTAIARRPPTSAVAAADPRVQWHAADIAADDLGPQLSGADALVNLAWAIQPSHDPEALWRTNVVGTARLLASAVEARVGTIVHASSVGAYSPAPKDRMVTEDWPTHGIATSFYARHKAYAERVLDAVEAAHPETRVVRVRPALVFKREAASGIRRLFAGPLLPSFALRPSLIPLVPDTPGLRFQVVHSLDVGEAFRLILMGDTRGAFNLAAPDILDPAALGRILGARPVPVPAAVLRAAAATTWRLHLQPTPEGWVDLGLRSPIMDCSRAARELGWHPTHSAAASLLELIGGLRDAAGLPTPVLDPQAGGRMRIDELRSGVGETEGRQANYAKE